jgi:predicted RNA-binding protein with PUA domain
MKIYVNFYSGIFNWGMGFLKYCNNCNTPLQDGACLYCYDNREALKEFEEED